MRIDYKHPIKRHLEHDLNTNPVSFFSLYLIISLKMGISALISRFTLGIST